jgi:hypothetical protein
MPTGYTAAVVDGKVTEFKDFAMSCARAFGALITMRDDPSDAPIPDKIEPRSYYQDRIAEHQKRLGDVLAMNNVEAEAAAKAAHAEALKYRADYLVRQDQEAARLNNMLAKARAWKPPTPDHVEMKDFMIQQLMVSLPGSYAPAIPELLDGETWRKREGDRIAKDIVYYKNEWAKEQEHAANRTQWLKALRASLNGSAH